MVWAKYEWPNLRCQCGQGPPVSLSRVHHINEQDGLSDQRISSRPSEKIVVLQEVAEAFLIAKFESKRLCLGEI